MYTVLVSGYKHVTSSAFSFSQIATDLRSSGIIFFRSKDTNQNLQSSDSKAFKLAIGIPVDTNTIQSAAEAGMTSLSQ